MIEAGLAERDGAIDAFVEGPMLGTDGVEAILG
jgi:hypothetical protein